MTGLKGRRLVVTGAGSGIGRSTALKAAAEGARVVALDIQDKHDDDVALAAFESGGTLTHLRGDVSIGSEIGAALDEAAAGLGGLDAVIHAAGIMAGQMEDIRGQSEATWDRVIQVNLKGAYLVAKHAARIMVPAGRGVIILVASKAGVIVGSGSFPYGASKGGVHGLSLTLDRHLSPKGIRVHDVCPGEVDTPLIRRSLEEAASRGADPDQIKRTLKNLASPDSIADLLVFLASDAASALRGTVFTA